MQRANPFQDSHETQKMMKQVAGQQQQLVGQQQQIANGMNSIENLLAEYLKAQDIAIERKQRKLLLDIAYPI